MTSKPNNVPEPERQLSFEQSFDELKDIVSRLENGNLTLSDSLQSYETGIKRLKECYRALNQAEHRIRLLTRLDADGNLDISSFDVDDPDQDSAELPVRRKSAKRNRQPKDDSESLF